MNYPSVESILKIYEQLNAKLAQVMIDKAWAALLREEMEIKSRNICIVYIYSCCIK